MTDLSGLMTQIPMADIARKLGVDESTAHSAVEQALPTLVHGLSANAANPAGAASLEKALPKHHKGQGTLRFDEVDEEDGEKIVNNVFGKKKPEVVKEVAKKSPAKVDESLVSKLLPILAPIVMSWLASKFLGQKSSGGGGGIGDVLGGLLGGGGSKGSSGGLGDVLGGLLGGGKR